MKDKKVSLLFVGGMYERDREAVYLQASPDGIQSAVNTQQINMIKGFAADKRAKVTAVTAPFLASYPKCRLPLVRPSYDGAIFNVGYINLPIIRLASRIFRLSKFIRTWTHDTRSHRVIYCYYVSIPQMLATIGAGSNATKVLIIPDMPSYLTFASNLACHKKIEFKIKSLLIQQIIKRFDRYVVVTKYMAEALNLKVGTYRVVEGMLDDDDIAEIESVRNRHFDNNDIVYAGGLHEDYDVMNLVDAMKYVTDKTVRLHIYGKGDLENEIRERAKIDSRIKYHGYKLRNEILNHQRSAKILINPRNNNHDYVRYSFPSKNLEYHASGTPILACMLDCIPQQYYRYGYYVENGTSEEIGYKIRDILDLPLDSLRKVTLMSLQFIKSRKRNINVCKNLMDWIVNDA